MTSAAPELARLTAVELRDAYAAKTSSPVEVLDAVTDIVDAREPTLNAFWQRFPEAAASAAKASEDRWANGRPIGPLDGIPLTLKENLAQAGVPMPAGTAGVVPVVPERNSPVADRVTEAGAVVLGATVMPDWGMLSSGVSSLHGVTRSPWNPEWTTGGSSSGAGAAAAAGYGPLHVGTDIGGSIRLPGTWLGLATLKPSAGRVPLDTPYLGRAAGPLCRTVPDAALLLATIARPDDRDWTDLPTSELDRLDVADIVDGRAAQAGVRGLRVGLQLDAGCGLPTDPVVAQAVTAVAEVFASAGAQVEEVTPWLTQDRLDDLDLFWRVRSWNDLTRLPPEGRDKVLPFIRRWVAPGEHTTGSRVLECYQSVMEVQRTTVFATHGYDVVLSPVAPGVAFPAAWPMPFGDVDRPDLGMAHIGFTVPYNMSGQPAATVNCGFTGDGRPIGVQLAGRRFDDAGVLAAAAWYEANRPRDAVPDWPIA